MSEVRGIRPGDILRSNDGLIWEVIGIATEPTATVRELRSDVRCHYVIGAPNWREKFPDGPLRAVSNHQEAQGA